MSKIIVSADDRYDAYDILMSEIFLDEDYNTRKGIAPEKIKELADSIDSSHLQTPITVIPMTELTNPVPGYSFRINTGHCRFQACKLLGWDRIPAYIRTGLSQDEMYNEHLSENIHRNNLTVYEEAQALRAAFPSTMTVNQISKKIGKTAYWVGLRLSILDLPQWIQDRCEDFTKGDLKAIGEHKNPTQFAKEILKAKKSNNKAKLRKLRGVTKPSFDNVRDLMKGLIDDGVPNEIVRLLGWVMGDVTDEKMIEARRWLKERRWT